MLKDKWNRLLVRVGDFLNRSRSPHTVKQITIYVFGTAFFIGAYILSIPYLDIEIPYHPGDIAEEDVRVTRDIRYELTDETRKLKKQAYEKERMVFDRDYSILKEIIDEIKTEIEILEKTSQEKKAVELARERLPYLNKNFYFQDNDVNILINFKDFRKMLNWALEYTTYIYDHFGVMAAPLSGKQILEMEANGVVVRTINTTDDQDERIWESGRLYSAKDLFGNVAFSRLTDIRYQAFAANIPVSIQKIIMFRVLQLYSTRPYMKFNALLTHKRKESATENVHPVTGRLQKGTVLVRAGDPVTKEAFEKINILNSQRKTLNYRNILGIILVLSILSMAISFYVIRFSGLRFRDFSSQVILHSLVLTVYLYGFFIFRIPFVIESGIYFPLFVPFTYVSIMTGVLFGARIALSVGIFSSFFLYILSGFDESSMILYFVMIMAGIYTSHKMEKRTHLFKGAMITALSMSGVVIGMDLILARWGNLTLLQVIIAVVNAYVGSILVSLVLPVYETIFNLPTRFRLAELLDTMHPLVKKLSEKAPATYTHSIMMSSLSERAALAINADALLVKVGCLYHDIGKTKNPEFFTENKILLDSDNRYSTGSLPPLDSARMVINHVVEGIELGKAHRLPEKIIAFIPEHHGTTLVQYFYHQALEKKNHAKNAPVVHKMDFQYPGPKPQTKETGIVMIADSLEAAARSIEKPSEEAFRNLIDRIVKNKMAEKQLEESGLTIGDLRKIEDAFLEVLLSVYHGRIKYPTQSQTNKLVKKVENRKKPSVSVEKK